MSVMKYRISLLELKDCPLCLTPKELFKVLKAWHKKNEFANVCTKCNKQIPFGPVNFGLCCDQFYFKDETWYYVMSIAVPTPGYCFLLPQLERNIRQANIQTNQDFLVLPDPIY